MKTKLISPWNLKPGMKIVLETVPRDMARDGNPRAFKVEYVKKTIGTFTGASVWQVKYKDKTSSLGYGVTLYHGKMRNLAPDKVLIEVQPEVKATVTPNGIKFKA